MKRYVALGSSMAAGPGIRPRAGGSPWRAGRSARNYPHLVAERLNLDLIDVTYSGATTPHVLTERQHGVPPQIAALDGSESAGHGHHRWQRRRLHSVADGRVVTGGSAETAAARWTHI